MPTPQQSPSSSSSAPSSSQPSSSSPSSSSSSPSSSTPSSSSGNPSSSGLPSSGLPLPSTPGIPPPPGAGTSTGSGDPQQSTTNGPERTADNEGDSPGQSSDGWLEGEPTGGNGDQGDWQTSNQGIPENVSGSNADGGADTVEVGGDDTTNGADQALTEALEELDGEILAERAVLRENEAATNRSGGNGSQEATANEGAANKASSTAAAPTSRTNASTRGRATGRPPPPKRGDSAAVADLPDAKDDDIIARQLREAAMQESDPELKEKLWEEYRRYKKG